MFFAGVLGGTPLAASSPTSSTGACTGRLVARPQLDGGGAACCHDDAVADPHAVHPSALRVSMACLAAGFFSCRDGHRADVGDPHGYRSAEHSGTARRG
ncbi:hypothetical protein ACU4GD_21180 [Cupriavidus basilensis]